MSYKVDRCVSYDVLCSIPWASTSRLVSIIDQVVKRGPNTRKTWLSLISRANNILHSFNSKNLSRMIVLLSKCSYCDQHFVKKLKQQSMNSINEADLLSCSGILHGLDKMGVCDNELMASFRDRIFTQLDTVKLAYPLILLLNLYARSKDRVVVEILLNEVLKYKDTITPQGYAMLLVDVLSNFDDNEMYKIITPLMLESSNHFCNMDLRSLIQLFNAFSKSFYQSKNDYIELLSQHINKHIEWATIHQLSMVLNGMTNSVKVPDLFNNIIKRLELRYHVADVQQLVFILSSLLKLSLKDHSILVKISERIESFNNIDGMQFANYIYMIGKWNMKEPPIEYIKENFMRLKDTLTFRELGLIAFGLKEMDEHSLDNEMIMIINDKLLGVENIEGLINSKSYNMMKHLIT